MNELLQQHGCSNIFTVPEGLRELMADITREVLRAQPEKLYDFIANYLSALLITREHGVLSVKIVDDLCDWRPTLTENLKEVGVPNNLAEVLSEVIRNELLGQDPTKGKETVKELKIVEKMLRHLNLDEEMTAKVCQVTRNAYRDYIYKKGLLKTGLRDEPNEPWEKAAEHTLRIYKTTKPSFADLNRAAQIIQSAYRGYLVRRDTLEQLRRPTLDRTIPPADVSGSREIDLGHMLAVEPGEDDVEILFHDIAPIRATDSRLNMLRHIRSSNLLHGSLASMSNLKAMKETLDITKTKGEKEKGHSDCTTEYTATNKWISKYKKI